MKGEILKKKLVEKLQQREALTFRRESSKTSLA